LTFFLKIAVCYSDINPLHGGGDKMNNKVLFFLAAISILTLACAALFPAAAPTITPVPPTITIPPPTDTPIPTATTAPTETPIPVPTPTLIILPQQWNGFYYQAGIGKLTITIILEDMKGDTFTGKMFWSGTSNFRGAITRIEGQYVTDFGDAKEQAMWGNVPDYRDGDRSGAWIKWTETTFVNGGGFTLGGWYYGHVRDEDTMTGIYYLNDKINSFSSSDYWELKRTE
jgi:hypothetical protein